MEELPLPIQNFLRGPERDRISLELTQRYGLHADTAATFERAYIFMLLGVFTPDEFVEELRGGGIDEATIKNLAADVNELVFKRLREEERQGTTAPRPSAPPAAPVMQIGERPVPPPPVAPPVAAPPPPAVVTPPPPEPVPMAQMVPPPPAPTPIYSAPAPVAADPRLYMRTMATDMQMAQGVPPTPAPSFQPAPPPVAYAPQPVYQAPPPAPTPPVAPPPPPPAPQFVATAPVRLTPVDRGHDTAPIRKEFGTDPYREPIE